MAYTKSYSRINWKNYPNEETPINENNLNRIDGALDVVDDRTVELEATKVSKLDSLVASVEFIEATGVIKVTYYNGSVVSLDTKLEKIAVNFDYDKTTQKLVITLDDGTKQYIDLSSLITELEFVDSSTIGFEVSEDGTVRAKVLNNSIGADQLDPIYLTTITNKVAEAEASADEAKSYAVGGTGTREGEDEDNAKYYSEVAKQYGANVIDDTKKASNSTYSSEKIEDLVSEIIDDTATATGKTYSSEKIEDLLGDIKAEDISYDNTKSQLQATNAQDAVDELNGKIEAKQNQLEFIPLGYLDGTTASLDFSIPEQYRNGRYINVLLSNGVHLVYTYSGMVSEVTIYNNVVRIYRANPAGFNGYAVILVLG